MVKKIVKVGIIGLGCRGRSLLNTVLCCGEAKVVAICDLSEKYLSLSQDLIKKQYGYNVKEYQNYKDMLSDNNVEAIIIATSWNKHVDMAVETMRCGKYVAVEVAGGYDIEDCWKLVRTYEETTTPIMFLENCCYDKFELLATSLERSGKLGKVIYCHGAYSHDLREEILGGNINYHYRLKNYIMRNCENYPTHELGPISKLLKINRGNKFISLTSVATMPGIGLREFASSDRNPDKTLQNQLFLQGDVVVTTITCAGGEVITLKLNTTLPCTYSREFMVQGTKGYCQADTNIVALEDKMNMHEFYDGIRTTEKYLNCANEYNEFLPDIWKNITEKEQELGHGGMDYLELKSFFEAIINGKEMPIDVYDMAAWMAITPLSEQSISHGGMPQAIPDFTRGQWMYRANLDVVDFPSVK